MAGRQMNRSISHLTTRSIRLGSQFTHQSTCLRWLSSSSCIRHVQATVLSSHSSSRSISYASTQRLSHQSSSLSLKYPVRYAHFSMGPSETETHPNIIALPPFIQAVELADQLNVTMPKFAADCRFSFPEWWPRELTKKRVKKSAFNNVKALIFNFEESSAIARLYKKQPHLQMLTGSDLDRKSSTALVYDRPPVIAVLGHKDHGKTTLLDSLRGTRVAQKEEFGITQDTYSHTITLDRDTFLSERKQLAQPIAGQRRAFTFLDTPGHHSFTEMRTTAASHADICMLVVAADEGLSEQTFECLDIITGFQMPVMVVITKVDAPNSQPEKIRAHLKKLGAKILSADTPSVSTKGHIVAIEVSAHAQTNLDVLRRTLFDCTALLNLKVDLNDVPLGAVVESWREEKGRGFVVKVLLKTGMLRVGDYFVSDLSWGRVKDLRDSKGNQVTEICPGEPCEVMGLDGLPVPGSDFLVCSKQGAQSIVQVRRLEHEYPNQARLFDKESPAMQADPSEDYSHADGKKLSKTVRGRMMDAIVKERTPKKRHFDQPISSSPTIWDIPKFIEHGVEYEALPVVIKTNNVGSLRMLHDSIDRINAAHGSELINVVDATVGSVTKSDIQYASAWECPIYCFRAEPAGKREKEMMHQSKIRTIEYRHHELFIEDIWKHMNELHEKRKQQRLNGIDESKMYEPLAKGPVIHSIHKSLLALKDLVDEHEDDDVVINQSNKDEIEIDDWRKYVSDDEVEIKQVKTARV